MDVFACATAAVIAGMASGAMLDPASEAVASATPTEVPRVVERSPVSFRFLTREEGHEILLSDVHVRIEHPVGGTLYEGVSSGPFLVAYVPVGRYQIAASYEGRMRHMTLTVTQSEPRSVALYW